MSVGNIIGIIGGIVGAIGGGYALLEKLWLDKPKLHFEVHRNQINNFARQNRSRTEVVLSIANIGGGKLGIGIVYLQSLEKNECQEILLYFKGPYIQDWEKRQKIKAKLVIQDLRRKTIGEKELEIYIVEVGS